MDIRIAAYAVIIRDGEILLSHWNEHGRSGWTLPGGGIDDAEHPVQAAKREILEETGYHASIDRLLGIDTMVVPAAQRHRGDSPLYAMRIVYRATVTGGDLRNEVGEAIATIAESARRRQAGGAADGAAVGMGSSSATQSSSSARNVCHTA